MPSLGDTILGLTKLKAKRDSIIANLAEPLRLKLVAPEGGNPGDLRMLTYVPPGLPPGAPLVVVLHGCTQNAAAYDNGSGWSTLAERHGFAVLYPEQQRMNNASLCFNWFQPEDVAAGQGEVESIRQMTLQMIEAHELDGRRVFVTGLSAGGAMTAAMLATSPELFAGGGVIAGLPYGAASSMMEAFGAMNPGRHRTASEWGDLVRRTAGPGREGHWPAVQIWQGSADGTVNPANAAALAAQWADVMGLPQRPDLEETVDGAEHEVWRRGGRAVLERWTVPGLAHGTPILADDPDADRAVGSAGPFMLASGVPSTWHLARAWGLLTQAARPSLRKGTDSAKGWVRGAKVPLLGVLPAGPGGIIEKAMRAARLLK